MQFCHFLTQNYLGMFGLALQRIAENKAKHARGEDARVLDLGNCGLYMVPEEVKEMLWLEELLLCNNTELLSLFPIANLEKLKKIDISVTSVSDISPLKMLKNLTYLDANHTNIADLRSIANHGKLKYVDVSFTKIQSLESLVPLLRNGINLHLESSKPMPDVYDLSRIGGSSPIIHP